MRNNPQIWRIAKWLWKKTPHPMTIIDFEERRDDWYDMALKLMTSLVNNEFTGEDNHEG